MSPEYLPRQLANKSSKDSLLRAIRMSLEIESPAVRHNTQTFNRNRYSATRLLPDYEALKNRARAIKEKSIACSPELLEKLEQSVKRNGGQFFLAKDSSEARDYIKRVCLERGVRSVVKGKSMTSEEIRLNGALEGVGIRVSETDLAEFILQVADEQPSHIVAPALHYSRERITELFRRKFETNLPLETGEDLTRFARERLREAFLTADAGITGANLIAADSGTLLLVESEANIRMSSIVPPLHIAIAGLEKVVPTRADFAPFIELLAASATGQPLSTYTSIFRPPLPTPFLPFNGAEKRPREFHLVIVDNGREAARRDSPLSEALYCLRCSACLNSCANFQTVGGHAFGGETYSGGIGGSWEAIASGKIENARFSELCTGCSRCVPQCPVRINIPRLNTELRKRMLKLGSGSAASSAFGGLIRTPASERVAPLQKQFFANYHKFAQWGVRLNTMANVTLSFRVTRWLMEKILGIDQRRALPPLPKRTFVEQASTEPEPPSLPNKSDRVVLLADTFNNYGAPEVAIAGLRLLRSIGVDVVVSDALPDGRAALSQGLVETASKQAEALATHLSTFISKGFRVVVIEPSVLAMLVADYGDLISQPGLFASLRANSSEIIEFVAKVLASRQILPTDVFDVQLSPLGQRLFVHTHCQQKTYAHPETSVDFLRAIGFEIETSQVECCGMAGSFGYKKDFYELSAAVGADLYSQAEESRRRGATGVLAFGISCTEQLRAGINARVLHPVQLLQAIVRPNSKLLN